MFLNVIQSLGADLKVNKHGLGNESKLFSVERVIQSPSICSEHQGTNCDVTKEVGLKMCEAFEHFDKVI